MSSNIKKIDLNNKIKCLLKILINEIGKRGWNGWVDVGLREVKGFKNFKLSWIYSRETRRRWIIISSIGKRQRGKRRKRIKNERKKYFVQFWRVQKKWLKLKENLRKKCLSLCFYCGRSSWILFMQHSKDRETQSTATAQQQKRKRKTTNKATKKQAEIRSRKKFSRL